MSKLFLVSDVPVSVNEYLKPKGFILNVNGRQQVKLSLHESNEAKDYKKKFVAYAKKEVIKQKWKYIEGRFVIVKATIYFSRTNRDANNIWKLMLDALTEAKVWKDDNIVMEHVERIYYDAENPRVELEIYNSPNIGIFNDENEYSAFNEICMTCSRYKGNCSILAKCLESRILSEININNDGIKYCSKFKEIKIVKEKIKKNKNNEDNKD